MGYKIMARYYAEKDNFGESYVITSTNSTSDAKLEPGTEVHLLPIEKLLTAMENMELESGVDNNQGDGDDIIDLSSIDKVDISDPEEPTLEPQFFKEGRKKKPDTTCGEPTQGPKRLTKDQLSMSCQSCPIRRTCPPNVLYNSDVCNTDLENYYYSIAREE